MQATLFLAGLYEDTGNLTFPSTSAEDAHAAAFLLTQGGDLSVLHAFLSPIYGQKHKEILFDMLAKAKRTKLNGITVSINHMIIQGFMTRPVMTLTPEVSMRENWSESSVAPM